ncbi:MAG TPA: M20/M25/M40 family metallo-hydrolase [Thermoleophilia bacterium]|nr:M20/M25/M40 family metallo-hydrolase [Thermoleophilia bacterium]
MPAATLDLDFLRDLCLAPGPSGYEEPVQQVVARRARGFAEVESDALGNVLAHAGAGAPPHVLIAAHADQIGAVVTSIDEHGFLLLDKIGHLEPDLLPGKSLVVWTAAGPVEAVAGHRPWYAVQHRPAEKKPSTIDEHWLDIGAQSREEALSLVAIGDPVTFAPRFAELAGGRYASPALDDRAGVYVAFRALELVAAERPAARLTAVATLGEETVFLGARALAASARPDVVIAVDVTFASDHPSVGPKELRGRVDLGAGPVLERGTFLNKRLFRLACDVADDEGIPVQVHASGGETLTDADELMVAASAATMLVSVPVRYMHSPAEVVHGDDVEATARLLAALCRRIASDFEPGIFAPRL